MASDSLKIGTGQRHPIRTSRLKTEFDQGVSDTVKFYHVVHARPITMSLKFNLIDKHWIPVLNQKDGTIQDVGLRDLLVRAHELREIAHDSPLVVASLTTLLVALLQSALQGETQRQRDAEWKRLWNLGRFDESILDAYFEQWSDRFDLFSEKFPFYQTAGLEMEKTSSIERLMMAEWSGGIYANQSEISAAQTPPALAAMALIATQSFVIGLGIASKVKVAGKSLEVPRLTGGILMSGLTVWPTGANLFETLMLNTVTHERALEDAPCWELGFCEPLKLRDTPLEKSGNAENAPSRRVVSPHGICDLLTLQSRLIRLLPQSVDGEVFVPEIYFSQGRSFQSGNSTLAFHPFKLYEDNKKIGFLPLGVSEGKAIWRNSAALLSEERRKRDKLNNLAFVSRQARAGILQSPSRYSDAPFRASLDVVGLAVNPQNAASVLLWRHDRLPLPLALLLDENAESRVATAIGEADALAEEMRVRFSVVARALLMPERLGSGISPDPDDVKGLVNKFDPRRAFWPQLETPFLEFLTLLPDDYAAAHSAWQARVEKAANDSFGAACNALGDGPRAVVAVAQVYPNFSLEFLAAQKNNRAAKTTDKAKNLAA